MILLMKEKAVGNLGELEDHGPNLWVLGARSQRRLKNVWEIYVLILKKPDHPPLLYMGSGTAAKRGVRARLAEYRSGTLIRRHAGTAIREGYTITLKALLAHCPLPAATDIRTFRTVVVAMEAALSCLFWEMYSRLFAASAGLSPKLGLSLRPRPGYPPTRRTIPFSPLGLKAG